MTLSRTGLKELKMMTYTASLPICRSATDSKTAV